MTISPVLVAVVILLAVGMWLARYRRRRNWLYVSAALSRLYLAVVYVVLLFHPMDVEFRAQLLRLGLLALFATEIVANLTALVAEHKGYKK